MPNLVESGLGTGHFTLGDGAVSIDALQRISFNPGNAVLERVTCDWVEPQVTASFQDLTFLLEKYVLLQMVRRFRWSLLSPSRGTEQRVFRRTKGSFGCKVEYGRVRGYVRSYGETSFLLVPNASGRAMDGRRILGCLQDA